MKKFFTSIPLQKEGQLIPYLYKAVDNQALQMDEKTCFPIMTAINGYAKKGQEIRVVALATDNEDCHRNAKIFEEEVQTLCDKKGVLLPKGVEFVFIPEDDSVFAQAQAFLKLLPYIEDDDELHACMTYGTKPQSEVMMMALKYGYRIKMNTSMSCVVYGKVVRAGQDKSSWYGEVYDMTALLQMDELVRLMADNKVQHPEKMLDHLMTL